MLEIRRLNRKNENLRRDLKKRAKIRYRQALCLKQNEDFAQWIALRTLEGVGLKQKIDHAFIDYLREMFGCNGPKNHRSLEDNLPIEEIDSFERFLAENKWIDDLKLQERIVVCMLALGFKKLEISMILGVNASRISQIVTVIKEKVK